MSRLVDVPVGGRPGWCMSRLVHVPVLHVPVLLMDVPVGGCPGRAYGCPGCASDRCKEGLISRRSGSSAYANRTWFPLGGDRAMEAVALRQAFATTIPTVSEACASRVAAVTQPKLRASSSACTQQICYASVEQVQHWHCNAANRGNKSNRRAINQPTKPTNATNKTNKQN